MAMNEQDLMGMQQMMGQEGGMPPEEMGTEQPSMMEEQMGGSEQPFDPSLMEQQPDMGQDPAQLADDGLAMSPADSMMDEEMDAGEAVGLDPVADALNDHIMMYIDFAQEVRKDKELNLQTRSKILLDMSQAVGQLLQFHPSSQEDKTADLEIKQQEFELKKAEMMFQLQLKQQEHQMNMQMKQEEMQLKSQENQLKLQMTQQQNQMKLQQQEENHRNNIVQSQEGHETKMEQQKQAAQLKQSSKQGSDKA